MKTIIEIVLNYFPLIAPIPTAWAIGAALEKQLHWPLWIVIIAALTIEGAGLVAADTASKYYEFNRTSEKDETRAPAWIAYGTFVLYFVVTIGLTLIYEPLAVLFPGLSAVGFLLFVLRKDQQEREQVRASNRQEAAQEKARKKQEAKDKREAAKQEKEVTSKRGKIGSDATLIAYLSKNPGLSQQKIADHFGVSRSAVGQRINSLKERNVTAARE